MDLIKNSLLSGSQDVVKKKPVIAYYLIEKDGGYQPFSVHIEEDMVLDVQKLGDPDGWDQSIGVLEQALAKQFQ